MRSNSRTAKGERKVRIPLNSIVAATLVLPLVLVAPVSLTAQRSPAAAGPSAVTGPAPRMPSGKPDLNGIWERPYVPDMTRNGRDQQGFPDLPFTPSGLADWKSYDAANGDYTGSCMPFGFSRSINSPYPVQIVQNDKYVALLFEQNTWFHAIPTDGRGHPKGDALNPTWFGNSVGSWNGDTLVVDTVGFNGYTRLDTIGHPHSDALHLVQTFRRTDAEHIAYTITVDDPKTYTKPWKNERIFTLSQGELIEYSCEENNVSLWEGRIKPWTPPWRNKPK
jgi:hypothetical protein